MAGIDEISRFPEKPLIEIVNLSKTYRRVGGATLRPVDNISLTAQAGELVVLLGPSGCGKTTLLRCIAGLEKPDEGEIRIDGQVVFSAEKGIFVPAERRRLSMIFQSYALWPHMSVAQNVAYPLESRRMPGREIPARVQKVLDMVGVGGLGEQFPGRLSGGQQQRVALARALIANTNIVLFDEPLSNVDAQVRAQLRFELKRMQRQLGFCGIYVTHDQTEAMELGHKVVVLDSGRIAAMGPPRSIYDSPPNAYVANFVGTANLLDGTILRREAGIIEVETTLGTISVAESNAVAIEGDRVKIVLRPETLSVSLQRPMAQETAIPVTVEAINFAGSHNELVVKGNEELIRVWSQSPDGQLSEGQEAWLVLSPSRLRLVAADTSTLSTNDQDD